MDSRHQPVVMQDKGTQTCDELSATTIEPRVSKTKRRFAAHTLFLIFVLVFFEIRSDTRWLQSHNAAFRGRSVSSMVSSALTRSTMENKQSSVVPQIKTKLEFIHITKTGGSAIEIAAAKGGVSWGFCHYLNKTICPTHDKFPEKPLSNATGMPSRCSSPWHIPPRHLAPSPFKRPEKKDSVFFAVVRDPYDRMISEFYCPHAGFMLDKTKAIDRNATVLNWWTQNVLSGRRGFFIEKGWSGTMHYIPQHYYVYDEDGTQLIKHVLRYETLHQDFPNLMSAYNLTDVVKLPKRKINRARVGQVGQVIQNITKLSAADFSRETLQLINKIYKDDFDRLGYKMRDPMLAPSLNLTGFMER